MATTAGQLSAKRQAGYDLPGPCAQCSADRHDKCAGRGSASDCVCWRCRASDVYASPEKFTKRELAGYVFDAARHRRRIVAAPSQKRTRCTVCGRPMLAIRRSRKYCGESCRSAASRARKRRALAEAAEQAERDAMAAAFDRGEIVVTDRAGRRLTTKPDGKAAVARFERAIEALSGPPGSLGRFQW